jgi:hypothetical protein
MKIIKRIKRYFLPTFPEWLDDMRIGVRLSTLKELKDELKIEINKTKEYDQLAALCLSFGEALRVRLPEFNFKKLTNLNNKEELIRILKHKKKGTFHCPYCIKKLKEIELPGSKDRVLYCRKCKLFYPYPSQNIKTASLGGEDDN